MRFGFLIKGAVVLALVIVFDRLFLFVEPGATIGIFAAAWLGGVWIAKRDTRSNGWARAALIAGALFAGALFYDPGPLAWTLFWAALSMAVLLPKASTFDDAWHWLARLTLQALTGLARPFADLARIWGLRRNARANPRAVAATLALPFIGGALFIALFVAANPLIEHALADVQTPSPLRMLLWAIVALCLWPSMRPHAAVMRLAAKLPDPEPSLPGTSLPSVLIALALFNAIFAVQNGLDIAFLWSGGPLPAGVTPAEYAHRGAYPLIVTVLIAGAMALAMLRPGSASAAHPWARGLVTLWVAQNLVLVASSALRTIDYIEVSMLTAWRIAALIWMALVALGLVLICVRILSAQSARWLINRNALAAVVVLSVCSVLDLGAIAAAWNVQAQRPDRIDLCYLRGVGDGAIVPLIHLEQRPMDATTRDRVRAVRAELLASLANRQTLRTGWTPRGARLLDEAQAALAPTPAMPLPTGGSTWRNCDGSINDPSINATRP